MTISTEQVLGLTDHHVEYLNESVAIHRDIIEHWQLLVKAAAQDGFSLDIASGFRSFERQKSIWNRKFNGELTIKNADNEPVTFADNEDWLKIKAILQFSALPGASRHHWGTDIDVYSQALLPANTALQLEPWEYDKNGPFEKLAHWLNKNVAKFGFLFPYNKFRGGVAQEPWHLTYIPLAKQFQQQLSIELIKEAIINYDVLGKNIITKQLNTIYNQFIMNINEDCYE